MVAVVEYVRIHHLQLQIRQRSGRALHNIYNICYAGAGGVRSARDQYCIPATEEDAQVSTKQQGQHSGENKQLGKEKCYVMLWAETQSQMVKEIFFFFI